MTAIIFDYAAIASRMNGGKPHKVAEDEAPAKKGPRPKNWDKRKAAAPPSDEFDDDCDDDEEDDGF